MKLFKYLLIVLVALTTLCGCGYHVGSIMHPQIKTIAIAPVVNETLSYNVSAEMRQMLSEQFMVDGSLKLVDLKKADCIIYVRVKSITFSEVTSSSYNSEYSLFIADEWSATVNAEYSVIIPGRKEPLISTRSITGSADFSAPGDMDPHRRRGTLQACRDAAMRVVESVTEAW